MIEQTAMSTLPKLPMGLGGRIHTTGTSLVFWALLGGLVGLVGGSFKRGAMVGLVPWGILQGLGWYTFLRSR